MNSELENKALQVGDVISLDDENGEVVGDFEVIALFELNGRQYVALTPALDEAPAADEEDELDVFILGVEDNELMALDEAEEEAAFAKLDELLEDVHVNAEQNRE